MQIIVSITSGSWDVWFTLRKADSFGICTLYQMLSQLRPQLRRVETLVFIRVSTALGGRGSVNIVQGFRGFAVKFLREKGQLGYVDEDSPVPFIQGTTKIPNIINVAKPEPRAKFSDADCL
jgi:catalase